MSKSIKFFEYDSTRDQTNWKDICNVSILPLFESLVNEANKQAIEYHVEEFWNYFKMSDASKAFPSNQPQPQAQGLQGHHHNRQFQYAPLGTSQQSPAKKTYQYRMSLIKELFQNLANVLNQSFQILVLKDISLTLSPEYPLLPQIMGSCHQVSKAPIHVLYIYDGQHIQKNGFIEIKPTKNQVEDSKDLEIQRLHQRIDQLENEIFDLKKLLQKS